MGIEDGIIVISQLKSLGQAMSGDLAGARETQKNFGKTVSAVADALPGVGHLKGAIHYACDDKEGGDKATEASSMTAAVIGGGLGGFVAGGPAGAVAGGIAGTAAMGGLITGIDSAVNGK